jgi:hypothetical protein
MVGFGNKFKCKTNRLVSGVKLNNRLLTLGLILCIASLTLVGTVQAQTITAGVSPGMVFDYHVLSYWSSSDSYASIPQDLNAVNQTAHVEVRISDVNSTHVATANPYYFNNGTNYMDRGIVNLNTGEGYGFVAIIGANLNVGDLIHPQGTDGLTILDQPNRSYESGSRATNHVRIVDNNATAGYTATRDLYFDKATGILVEQVDRTETTSDPIEVSQITWKIDSTFNVEGWVIPEFPMLAVVPLFLLAATFAAIAYKKKSVNFPRQF